MVGWHSQEAGPAWLLTRHALQGNIGAGAGDAKNVCCGEVRTPKKHLTKPPWLMHYRRAQIPGATYFFTLNLANRKLSLLVDNIEMLKEAIRHVKMMHPYEIVAMVELSDATR